MSDFSNNTLKYYPEDRSLRVPWSVRASFQADQEPVVAILEDDKFRGMLEHSPEMVEFVEAYLHATDKESYILKSWAANLLKRVR